MQAHAAKVTFPFSAKYSVFSVRVCNTVTQARITHQGQIQALRLRRVQTEHQNAIQFNFTKFRP